MASRFLGGAAHATRSGGQLMSQFLVVGAPLDVAEESVVVDPSVLFVYPPGAPLVDVSLPLFCFPDGVRLKKLRRTASSSRINEVRYSNLATLESPRSSFTFLLTGHDEVLYGVCVHSEEMVDELPSLLAAAEGDSDRPRLRAGSVRASLVPPVRGGEAATAAPALCAPRCYCLISRFPFFKLHFDFLYALVAKDRHLRMAGGGAEAELLPLLRSYAEQPIPDDKKALSFKVVGDLHEFNFVLPGTDQDSLLEAFCGARVLSLGTEGLVTLASCLLQERKCVVLGEQLGLVSAVVLGLIPLLKPLVWQGSLVPLLPNSMHEALEAPVPFVFGIRGRRDVLPAQLPEDLVVVDVDRGEGSGAAFVVLPPMAQLPRADELRRALKTRPQLATINAHIRDLLRRADELLPSGLAGGWQHPEAPSQAAAAAPKNERAFWSRFLSTQLFHGHIGAQLDESEAAERLRQEREREKQRERAATAAAQRFDALIAAEAAAVKELEGLLEDHTRKLTMARERLEALQLARFEQL